MLSNTPTEAMSQSDDHMTFNLWAGNDFWSSTTQTELEKNNLWTNNAKQSVPANFSKLNGIVPIREPARNTDDKKSAEVGNSMLPWAAMGSVLQDVDLPAIWSAPKLCVSSDQNPSLSDHISWTPQSANHEVTERAPSVEPWDSSRDPLLFPVSVLDQDSVWKSDQLCPNRESNLSEMGTNNNVAFTAIVTDTSTTCSSSNFVSHQPASGNPNFEPGSSQKIPITTEGSSSLIPLSTEQICDHLINSNEGWGRRPIDQSTPWDSTDLMKSGDRLTRSGITTPTPVSRPDGAATGGGFPVFRTTLQTQAAESNVWTNEPPTGTAIWEMHYENSFNRSSWYPSLTAGNPPPSSASVQASSNPVMFLNNTSGRNILNPATVVNRAAPTRPWDQTDKLWNSGAAGVSSGRPVLGSARSSGGMHGQTQPDELGWCGTDQMGLANSGTVMENSNPNTNSWDGYQGAVGGPLHWNSGATGDSFLVSEEQRRQQNANNALISQASDRMLINPFNNTYRADAIKYLMSHGFKKEEALPVLIDCNMDPERALNELRERYSGARASFNLPASGTAGFPPNFGNMSQFQNTNNFTQSNQHPNSAPPVLANVNVGSTMFPPGPTPHRGKFPGTQNNAPVMPVTNHPNPHLIRQQLTQQVRSALNMSLPPNAMNGPMGNNSSVGVAGSSLLGQPPPPLLNGGATPTLPCGGPPALNSSTGSNFLPPNTRNPGSNPHMGNTSQSFGSNVPNMGKRSARQMTIITAIHDLHKKHQSIQQQIIMYRNNPTMCSQPQYADLFTELQGQMQQIEAQLKAKQAQLNIAYAQDCAAAAAASSTLGQSLNSPVVDVNATGIPMMSPNPSTPVTGATNPTGGGGGAQTTGLFQSNRTSQEHLVHQLMDLRLRPATTDGEADFPAIGTWTSYKGSNGDNVDKMSMHDGPGPRSVVNQRLGIGKSRNPSNWGSNTWQSSNPRSNVNHNQNWCSSQVDNASIFTQPNGMKTPNMPLGVGSGMMEQQPPSSGPWLLIQPTPTGGLGSNVGALHNILCHYGLTYFHALNPASGSVLVRLQSPEYAFQLMRALGDRVTVESITDPEKLLHFQRSTNARENFVPGHFNPPLEMDGTSIPASNWANCDSTAIAHNTPTNLYPTKKSTTTHGSSRLGVMVSGIH